MSSRKNAKNGSTIGQQTSYEYQFPQPKVKIPFTQFICNPKEGTFLGRDASSWYRDTTNNAQTITDRSYGTFNGNLTDGVKNDNYKIADPVNGGTKMLAKIILFYIIFYAVLAGLFAISMQGLFATLDDKEPKWKLDSSLIGTNPGLGYRPLGRETERGAIIDFETSTNNTQQYWIDLLDEFLEPYYNKSALKNHGRKQKPCDFDTHLSDDEVCMVDVTQIKACNKNSSYGYQASKPCIFLKLNKIFNWLPEYYNDISSLPNEMPQELTAHISGLAVNQREQVWVSCQGLNSHDKDSIKSISFPNGHGFPKYYYPFKNQDDYLSPLVPVQIVLQEFKTMVNIECRAWAKNIIYSGSLRDRKGSVTFQLMIDNKN